MSISKTISFPPLGGITYNPVNISDLSSQPLVVKLGINHPRFFRAATCDDYNKHAIHMPRSFIGLGI